MRNEKKKKNEWRRQEKEMVRRNKHNDNILFRAMQVTQSFSLIITHSISINQFNNNNRNEQKKNYMKNERRSKIIPKIKHMIASFIITFFQILYDYFHQFRSHIIFNGKKKIFFSSFIIFKQKINRQ